MVGSINYIKVKYMARNKDQINGITPIFRMLKEKGKKKKNKKTEGINYQFQEENSDINTDSIDI